MASKIFYTVSVGTFMVKLLTQSHVLLITSKQIGLEVTAEKTKYIFVSRDQNAGQVYNIKIGNHLNMTKFKIFGNNPDKSKLHS
jgi:hypothetical protein